MFLFKETCLLIATPPFSCHRIPRINQTAQISYISLIYNALRGAIPLSTNEPFIHYQWSPHLAYLSPQFSTNGKTPLSCRLLVIIIIPSLSHTIHRDDSPEEKWISWLWDMITSVYVCPKSLNEKQSNLGKETRYSIYFTWHHI